jgi:uncharacterized membrane-anchored protein
VNIAMNSKASPSRSFRIIEICASSLGETGGDVLSMTLGLGYVASSAVFIGLFVPAMLA